MPLSNAPNFLQTIGTLIYNGVNLTGSELTTGIDMQCRYDSSGRSLELVDITFTIRKIFKDVDIEDTLNRLTQPGGWLVFTGFGWKELSINDPGNRASPKDAEYGPKPGNLKWRRLGGNTYWELQSYTLKTAIPFCFLGTPIYKGALQSFCFGVDFDIDEEGMTVRTITGHITIPATRAVVTARFIQDHADAYRDLLRPLCPQGFKRASQKYSLSEDKRTLNFTIVDREINSDNAYPEGVISIDVDETLVNDGISFVKWDYTLSGTIKVARPFPQSTAWDKFYIILKKRFNQQVNAARQRKVMNDPKAPRGGIMWLRRMSFENSLFGRESRFAVTWLMATTLKGVLADSGMWSPVANTNWQQWRTSMATIWDERGSAGLGFNASNDLIIDLCEPGQTALGDDVVNRNLLQQISQGPDNQDKPDPESSWVEYQCYSTLKRDGAVVRHKPLPLSKEYQTNSTTDQPPPSTTDAPAWNYQYAQPGGNFDNNQPDIVQKVSNPTYTIRITGNAVRVGYPIVEPKLTTVDGDSVTAVESKSTFRCGVVGSTGDWPIYAATWDTEYIVNKAPKTLTVPQPSGM